MIDEYLFYLLDANGFKAEFINGATILNKYTNKPCQLSIEVIFDCDQGAVWSLDDNDPNKPARALDPTSYNSINFFTCSVRLSFNLTRKLKF
jgi:hypothetical protein